MNRGSGEDSNRSDGMGVGDTLYVDMDGTLTATDTLWESICLVLRAHPGRAWRLPIWALQGKTVLKARVAALVIPDATTLPYRSEVLDFLRREKETGRRLVLATASHERVAHAVADELGIFDGVLATNERSNLRGATKLAAMKGDSGESPFGYLGDSRADLPIWSGAGRSVVVDPTRNLLRSLERRGISAEVVRPSRSVGFVRPLIQALRPRQWSKNALLFVPITLAQQLDDLSRLKQVLLGFLAFCAVSSAGYLVNDLLDIEADRRHATKKSRPFAAGTLSIPAGMGAALLLSAFGFLVAGGLVSGVFASMLAIYLAATLSYSLYLKERLFLDVLVLAGLYTHRVLSGGVASEISVSTWLLAFSMFFFLSLALVKRYIELLQTPRAGRSQEDTIMGRAYQPNDTGLVETMGIASGYLSILVLALYVSHDDVTRYYARPAVLWLVTPLMLYWISRIWLLARRGRLASDPVLFATKDRVSYFILAAIAAIGSTAAYWGRGQ